MDIQTEKLKLISWLANVDDPKIIKRIIDIKKKHQDDLPEQFSDEERAEIEEILAPADAGLGKPSAEINERLRYKYGIL
jgi:hypothetical protein